MALYNADLNVSGTLTVPSGIFLDSVTVSGASVLTSDSAVGGGSGTITDINTVSTGPSVTITGIGGINTITEGNIITISGAGTFSPGWRGAVLTTTSGVSTSNDTVTKLPWDTAPIDTDGFFTPFPGDDTVVTIPAGINKVRITASTRWDTNSVGRRFIQIREVTTGIAKTKATSQIAASPTSSTVHHTETPVIDVVEGEQFFVQVRQTSGGILATGDSALFLSLEVIDPVPGGGVSDHAILTNLDFSNAAHTGFSSEAELLTVSGSLQDQITTSTSSLQLRNAFFTSTSGSSLANNTEIILPWDTVNQDIGGWVDPSDDSAFLVPSGVTNVRLWGQIRYQSNSSGHRRLLIRKNGEGATSDPLEGTVAFLIQPSTPDQVHQIAVSTATIPVVAGDTFRMHARQTSGITLNIDPSTTTFFIEEVKNVISVNDAITAASGTFTQSLTISGTPVNINPLVGKNLFRGARVHLTGGNDTVTTATSHQVAFDTTAFDTEGFVVGGDETQFVIPAGITKIRLRSQIYWASNTTGQRQLNIRKGTFPGTGGFGANIRPAGGVSHQVSSQIIDVLPGEIFLVLARQESGGDLDLISNAVHLNYFEVEVIEDFTSFNIDELTTISGSFTDSLTVSGIPVSLGGFKGALLTSSSGVDVPTSFIAIPYDTVSYDTDGFHNPSNVNQFLIPAGVSKVRMTANARFNSDAGGERALIIVERLPGGSTTNIGGLRVNANTNGVHIIGTTTPVWEVTEGETYEVLTTAAGANSSPVAISFTDPPTSSYFSIEVVE